jgi:hypothetical protein
VEAFRWPVDATSVSFSFNTTNIAVGSSHTLINLLSQPDLPPLSYWVGTYTNVNITELGPVGGYFSGNFSGQVISQTPPNPIINIAGKFRFPKTF